MPYILVVDDEVGIRELLSEILTDEGYTVRVAENASAAREVRNEMRPDLVLLDIWMPDMDGISLLKEWRHNGQLNMPVVVMSGHATIDTAVEGTRIGAVDFLEKPIALQKLLSTVKNAIRHSGFSLRSSLSLNTLTRSDGVKEFRKRLDQIGRGSHTVYLKGVSGAIAELCARSLQQPQAAWLDLAELTSPVTQEQLQKTQGGIVFCGNLASLGKMQQMSLAYILDRLERLDLTLVLGSQKPLVELEPTWEPALLKRVGEIWIEMPPLARCQDDIPEIANLLLAHLVETKEVAPKTLSVGVQNRLRQLEWRDHSGGWMSLLAVVRNLALSSLEEEIQEDEINRVVSDANAAAHSTNPPNEQLACWLGMPLREARDAFERCYFEYLLEKAHGNITRVAEQAGLERTHLYRKLKQLGVSPGAKRTESS